MPIPPRSRLGPFEIVSPLGAGGMGEVYRARDTKLDRDVAVKVLPEEFFEDRDRVARFEREAKALAALNHPGIAAIYSFEAVDGRHILVMELVEGEGLDSRIARGAIPLEEALPIARQIAESLEAAHEKGIVHRDLKPANVMVTPEGRVKILDFGLAKAFETDAASGSAPRMTQSPTITARGTQAGVILGTAAYMSPEQARGRAADKRADIWAFGALFFEMLAGRRAFEGETVSDMLAAVLKTDPDWTALPVNTPGNVRKVLRRCLERERTRRFHDIADARIELDNPLEEQPAPGVTPTREAPGRRPAAWMLAALFLLAVAAVLGVLLLGGRTPARPVVRASILLPPKTQLALDGTQPGPPAISPDGRRIVFVLREAGGARRLWMREIDWEAPRPIEGTDDASYPFWSPDNRTVGFFSQHKLKKVAASGGPVLTLGDAPTGKGGTWNSSDVILFCPTFNAPLFRVTGGGGTPAPVTKLDLTAKESSHRFPQFLPDGRHFLYLVRRDGPKNLVRIGSLDGGSSETIFETESQAVLASGSLLFLRERTLMAQAFDAKTKRLKGQPAPLAERIRVIPGAARALFTASETGDVLYQTGETNPESRLTWVDRRGTRIAAFGEAAGFSDPALSPDGTRIAVRILDPTLNTNDIWTLDAKSGNRMRVTFDPGNEVSPIWSPDGKRLAYASNRRGPYDLYAKDLAGGEEKVVLQAQRAAQTLVPNSWLPDGRFLLYTSEDAPSGSAEVWSLDLAGKEKPRLLAKSRSRDPSPFFSPNGRWIALAVNDEGPGADKLVVLSFAQSDRRWQIAGTGSGYPFWRPDGKELYYLDRDLHLTAVEVRQQTTAFEWGPPETLFANSIFERLNGGGDRFLKVEPQDKDADAPLTLLLNWPALLPGRGSP